jgi:TatD DNase family protein
VSPKGIPLTLRKKQNVPVIDTHCHLTHARFKDDVDAAVARAVDAGVTACITIGTGVADAICARDLARRHAGVVFATAGLDPFSSHAAGDAFDDRFFELEALLTAGGFVGVGEIGLDYHYDLDSRPIQAERFEKQLDLASRLDLPVVIHVREAHEDLAAILSRHSRSFGVIHSFTGGPVEAGRYLSLGWMLAFNGVITFKNADDVREAARIAPRDRIVVETDSPYLAPNPKRGTRCEPAFVAHTLRALAAARNDDVDGLAGVTSENASRLFRLPA